MPHPALERADRFVKIAGVVFIGAGALMIAGGLLLAIDDPAGLFLSLFGLVFVGAGLLARRMFATPAGKKAVVLSQEQATVPGGTRASVRFVHVDEDASDEEVAALRRQWLRERWQSRPDWASGDIEDQDRRQSGLHGVTLAVMCVVTLAAAAVGVLWSEVGWMLAFATGISAGVLGFQWLRGAARRRKFGDARFLMSPCPAVLGGTLAGRVLTGVPQTQDVADGFRLRLRCVHRYERSEREPGGGAGTRRSRRRVDVLWEQERTAAGRPSAKRIMALEVPVAFDLPHGQPPSSVDSGDGMAWELAISANIPGLDYGARFEVPVFDAATASAIADASGR